LPVYHTSYAVRSAITQQQLSFLLLMWLMVDWWMANWRSWLYWSGVCHRRDDVPARKSWWGRLSP